MGKFVGDVEKQGFVNSSRGVAEVLDADGYEDLTWMFFRRFMRRIGETDKMAKKCWRRGTDELGNKLLKTSIDGEKALRMKTASGGKQEKTYGRTVGHRTTGTLRKTAGEDASSTDSEEDEGDDTSDDDTSSEGDGDSSNEGDDDEESEESGDGESDEEEVSDEESEEGSNESGDGESDEEEVSDDESEEGRGRGKRSKVKTKHRDERNKAKSGSSEQQRKKKRKTRSPSPPRRPSPPRAKHKKGKQSNKRERSIERPSPRHDDEHGGTTPGSGRKRHRKDEKMKPPSTEDLDKWKDQVTSSPQDFQESVDMWATAKAMRNLNSGLTQTFQVLKLTFPKTKTNANAQILIQAAFDISSPFGSRFLYSHWFFDLGNVKVGGKDAEAWLAKSIEEAGTLKKIQGLKLPALKAGLTDARVALDNYCKTLDDYEFPLNFTAEKEKFLRLVATYEIAWKAVLRVKASVLETCAAQSGAAQKAKVDWRGCREKYRNYFLGRGVPAAMAKVMADVLFSIAVPPKDVGITLEYPGKDCAVTESSELEVFSEAFRILYDSAQDHTKKAHFEKEVGQMYLDNQSKATTKMRECAQVMRAPNATMSCTFGSIGLTRDFNLNAPNLSAPWFVDPVKGLAAGDLDELHRVRGREP